MNILTLTDDYKKEAIDKLKSMTSKDFILAFEAIGSEKEERHNENC